MNGFLVDSVEAAAQRLTQLLRDEKLRAQIGERARETVRQQFLMPRLLEQYLDLFRACDRPHKSA